MGVRWGVPSHSIFVSRVKRERDISLCLCSDWTETIERGTINSNSLRSECLGNSWYSHCQRSCCSAISGPMFWSSCQSASLPHSSPYHFCNKKDFLVHGIDLYQYNLPIGFLCWQPRRWRRRRLASDNAAMDCIGYINFTAENCTVLPCRAKHALILHVLLSIICALLRVGKPNFIWSFY